MAERKEIIGKVFFHCSQTDTNAKSWCACCGDPHVPHPHVYGEYIGFPTIPSLFPGLTDQTVQDYCERFIHENKSHIEGKRIKVTFEILDTCKECDGKESR